jgi:ABC-type transport system substrate-binding protein
LLVVEGEWKMLRSVERVCLSGFILVLMFAVFADTSFVSAGEGPREDDVIIKFYENAEVAYEALYQGEADMILQQLTKNHAMSAREDVNIALGGVSTYDMFQLDLNNNYTILSNRGVRSMLNYTEMRRAIAWLTDKDYIVDEFCGGFAERIDQMVPAPLKGWANESYWFPNYPYEYDPLLAAAELDAGGFLQGTTANPGYDAGFPGSAEYIRTYPTGHSKAGQDLDPIVFACRNDDTRRLQAGRLVADNMKKHGLPLAYNEDTKTGLYDQVMGDFDYHVYTGGWASMGRWPASYLYGLYHSDNAHAYGPNYVTGNGTHPALDWLLKPEPWIQIELPPETPERTRERVKDILGWMTIYCVNVPLFSPRGFWGWRNDLLGVVSMESDGPDNVFSDLNVYKADGSPVTYGLTKPPHRLNIVYSTWVQDYQVLNRMNVYGGQGTAPYNLAADQNDPPLIYHKFGDWYDSGYLKSKVIETYRTDGYYCEPVTGNQKQRVNATDYFWNAWYDYQLDHAWFSSSFADLNHINIVNSTTFEICFETRSFWNTYGCQGPLRPTTVWFNQPTLVGNATETFTEGSGSDFEAPGIVPLANEPIWIDYVEVNDVPLTPYTDYNIYARGGGPTGNLEIVTPIVDGSLVEVMYRYPGDPHGYTPGNVTWETIFEGAGMYYATSFTPGEGGSITLKKNPFYFMETPPLGEIDFARKSDGAMKVDIFDLVIAAGAFGSTGTGAPERNWWAGADVAPAGGIVDVLDVVTVVSNWNVDWDMPH